MHTLEYGVVENVAKHRFRSVLSFEKVAMRYVVILTILTAATSFLLGLGLTIPKMWLRIVPGILLLLILLFGWFFVKKLRTMKSDLDEEDIKNFEDDLNNLDIKSLEQIDRLIDENDAWMTKKTESRNQLLKVILGIFAVVFWAPMVGVVAYWYPKLHPTIVGSIVILLEFLVLAISVSMVLAQVDIEKVFISGYEVHERTRVMLEDVRYSLIKHDKDTVNDV